jgi:hypothetical protein
MPSADKVDRLQATWNGPGVLTSVSFVCGYCGDKVGASQGYASNVSNYKIAICPTCNKPTFLEGSKATPARAFGSPVAHVPEKVSQIYEEARRCMTVNSPTCAVLALRTLLAHIAVERGAKAGLSFQAYVKYLTENGFAPAGSGGWVDSIRERGNEAAHDLEIMNHEQAEQVISFAEMILKFLYEFPARVLKNPPPTSGLSTTPSIGPTTA